MGKIEDLIQQYCPNGVEYKSLSEIATSWARGNGIKRDEVTEDGQPCVRYGEIYTTYGVYFTECVSHTAKDVLSKPKTAKKGSILFAITGESVEDIAKSTAYLGEADIYVGGDILIMNHNQNAKYLSYVLSTASAKQQKSKGKIKSKVVHTKKDDIASIVIPVPPLPVQEEIVRILDTFTELETKLETELELRKKQYECYRNKLLSLENYDGEVVETTLSAVAHYSKDRIDASELDENNYVGVDNMLQEKRGITTSTAVPATGTWTKFNKNDVLIGNIRPYLRKIWMADKEGGTNGDVIVYRSNDECQLYPRFLYHILASEDFFNYDNSKSKGAKMPRGNKEIIPLYQIHIPKDINEQIRIARILDKFDSLTINISEGLPAEIKMRHQQYVYYRDKILSFDRLEVV